MAESLWALSQTCQTQSWGQFMQKVVQEETPLPQIEEKEPITIVVWGIPELGILQNVC